MIKKLQDCIVYPMFVIVNKSLNEGVFPDMMKLAEIFPLYKSKEHDKIVNYRPISLLIVLSKIVEKCVHKRQAEFMESNGIFYTSQHGFRKYDSTNSAMCELTENVVKSLDEGY